MDLRTLLDRPDLDPSVEHELALAARAGDPSARAELLTAGLRWVALRVLALGVHPDAMDDALQDGAIALIGAVDRFDPDRGTRLSTWAWPWIDGAVRRSVHARPERPGNDREPSALLDLDTRLAVQEGWRTLPDADRELLAVRLGLTPDPPCGPARHEVAEHLGVSVAVVRSREARAMRHLRARLARVGDRAPR
ncbi:MAG: sigma-70 family RNA polymerase sigma factor [Aeromicrobium erythreum]